VQEERLLEPFPAVVGEKEGASQVKGGLAEDGILTVGGIGIGGHELAGGFGIGERASAAAGGDFEHQPGGLAFDDSFARHRRFTVAIGFREIFLNGKILVGERMRQFVNERGVAHVNRGPIGDEKLFAVKIVKSGGLLGEQIDGGLLQVEVGRGKTELFERDFFGADFIGFDGLPDLLLQVFVDLIAGNQLEGQLAANAKTGYGGQFPEDGIDFRGGRNARGGGLPGGSGQKLRAQRTRGAQLPGEGFRSEGAAPSGLCTERGEENEQQDGDGAA
jgi:hypothetical protein